MSPILSSSLRSAFGSGSAKYPLTPPRPSPNIGEGESGARWLPRFACAIAFGLLSASASAQDVLIRNATVHTVTARGALEKTDVLVRAGRIAAVGSALAAPAGAVTVEANGRPLTPGLFGGINGLGIEEVSLEAATVDSAHTPGVMTPPQAAEMRPEFDVSPAFNPSSLLIPVARVEGITWTLLAPASLPGGSIIAGQGGPVSLDGSDAGFSSATRTLFVTLGEAATPLTGNSRASAYMLLDQAVREARPQGAMRDGDFRLLTAAGRETLARYLGGGRIAFRAERASDIRHALAFAKRVGAKPVIVGGSEAWKLAAELARADVPVLIEVLGNLPASFDQLGAGYANAKLLHAAGVRIAFNLGGDAHNARKIRQTAGIAVAYGLPWDAALAALTTNPATIFGLGAERGRIEAGMAADLVLWSGDPLEVTTVSEQVWIGGRAIPMRSRQTELRDRYLPQQPALPRAYQR